MTWMDRVSYRLAVASVTAAALASFCLIGTGCTAVTPNSGSDAGNGTSGRPSGTSDATDQTDSALTLAGDTLFSEAHATVGGAMLACAGCHSADGSGDIGPDIRGESGDHLQEHAQGEGRHPDGTKFPDLTEDDFVAIAAFLGGSAVGASEGEEHDIDPSLVGDPLTGQTAFSTEHTTAGGAALACSGCHAVDGSGNIGPDIRGESGSHLAAHAQGSGRHPENVKFPELTDQDFMDIAAFLAPAIAEPSISEP